MGSTSSVYSAPIHPSRTTSNMKLLSCNLFNGTELTDFHLCTPLATDSLSNSCDMQSIMLIFTDTNLVPLTWMSISQKQNACLLYTFTTLRTHAYHFLNGINFNEGKNIQKRWYIRSPAPKNKKMVHLVSTCESRDSHPFPVPSLVKCLNLEVLL